MASRHAEPLKMKEANMHDPTSTSAAQLAKAGEAHTAAVQRHVAAAWRARDRHQAAVNQRKRLADGMAAGGHCCPLLP